MDLFLTKLSTFGNSLPGDVTQGLIWGIMAIGVFITYKILDFADLTVDGTLGLGLEDRMTSKVGLLSGGQRQALTLLMATLKKPQILLLDEHTAALDPKTAAKVLQLSDEIIAANHLTAMMVTHNMANAIEYGNRLIMMNDGRIIYDVKGEEKKNLTVDDLLQKFEEASGSALNNDRMLLSGNK